MKKNASRANWIFLAVTLVCCAALCFLPGPRPLAHQSGTPVRARVLAVDNSRIETHGLLRFGSQQLEVRLLEGAHKGETFRASNELRAQMELDKEFAPGDTAIVIVQDRDRPGEAVLTAQDHDRSFWGILLAAGFCILLCVFGGWTGAKALFSFGFSCLVIWKLVIPLVLGGWSASWTVFGATALLTAAIVYLVAGVTRKGLAAFAGASSGVLAGLVLAHLFGRLMKINGATMPYVQTLLYSGYENLDLQDLYIGAMMLACSGAVMDLAMDIASAVEEVARHNRELAMRELVRSGLRVGRSVVGTMTTTLLLAYSGGYITLLMVFAAQGTSPWVFLNNPLVAAETVKTLIGSFSLVLVAPFTAWFAGFLFRPKK